MDAFIAGEVDRVMLVYNEFRSVITQRVVVDQLLPIPRAEVDDAAHPRRSRRRRQRRPSTTCTSRRRRRSSISCCPATSKSRSYRALLESNAAFFAAQMTAMDTATKNSAEMIGSLTLYMNKVRQAAITREIIEVVSGAQAL